MCRHPLLNVPREHFLLVFHGTVEAPYLNARSAGQSFPVRIPRVPLAPVSFRHEIHALADAHGEHFPAWLRERSLDFDRGGISKHARILRPDQGDVTKSPLNLWILHLMLTDPAFC